MSQQSQNQMDVNHQQIQAAIAKVVWKDEKLRSEFVKNPKETIEKNLGLNLQKGSMSNALMQLILKPFTTYFPIIQVKHLE